MAAPMTDDDNNDISDFIPVNLMSPPMIDCKLAGFIRQLWLTYNLEILFFFRYLLICDEGSDARLDMMQSAFDLALFYKLKKVQGDSLIDWVRAQVSKHRFFPKELPVSAKTRYHQTYKVWLFIGALPLPSPFSSF